MTETIIEQDQGSYEDNSRVCANCGDEVATLSSRDYCDGCEEGVYLGHNIAGEGVILGARYLDDVEAYAEKMVERYSRTPVFPPHIISRGRYCHIGEGIWLHRCRECDDFVLTYGSILYIREFGTHERSHGLDVVGVNVAILGS